jgi:hypothetical protein
MISNIQLSEKSQDILNIRHLSEQEVEQFSALLAEAKNQQGSSKSKLLALSNAELSLLQKAHGLADPIQISSLSEEGATNLFSQVDHSDKVDLNNDGLVELGVGKLIIFPPVNAPEHVKLAWQKATAGMPEGDLFSLEIGMHHAVFGLNIEGYDTKPVLDPAEQWSQAGIEQLFKDLHGNLAFKVGLEGWTKENVMLKDFYQRFESAIKQQPVLSDSANFAPQMLDKPERTASDEKRSAQLIQLVLDARMGIDRKKLEQIEEKIQAIAADKQLTDTQKQQKIAALETLRQTLIDEAQQRSVELEKRKALLSKNDTLVEQLHEQKLLHS